MVARTVGIATALAIAGRAIAGDLRDERARWLVVDRDSGYTIAIDTSRIVREHGRTYEIWYRTDHASKRFYRGKAFTRETVHAILRCDGYSFRVISTTMPGSTDEKAALATCQLADWKSWGRH
jgi:hypothetical protein